MPVNNALVKVVKINLIFNHQLSQCWLEIEWAFSQCTTYLYHLSQSLSSRIKKRIKNTGRWLMLKDNTVKRQFTLPSFGPRSQFIVHCILLNQWVTQICNFIDQFNRYKSKTQYENHTTTIRKKRLHKKVCAKINRRTSPMQTSFDWCKSTASATPSKSCNKSHITHRICFLNS